MCLANGKVSTPLSRHNQAEYGAVLRNFWRCGIDIFFHIYAPGPTDMQAVVGTHPISEALLEKAKDLKDERVSFRKISLISFFV